MKNDLTDRTFLSCRFYISGYYCVVCCFTISSFLPYQEDLMFEKMCDIVSFVAVKIFSVKAAQEGRTSGKASERDVFAPQLLAETDY